MSRLDDVKTQLRKVRIARRKAEMAAKNAHSAWIKLEKEALLTEKPLDLRSREESCHLVRDANLQVEAATAAEADLLKELNTAAAEEKNRLKEKQISLRKAILDATERDIPKMQKRLTSILAEMLRTIGGRFSEDSFFYPANNIDGRSYFKKEMMEELFAAASIATPNSIRALVEEEQRTMLDLARYNPEHDVRSFLQTLDTLGPE